MGLIRSNSRGTLFFMVELRKKIITFRDIIDLPPCDGSAPINELVIGLVEDLHNLYPNVVCYYLTPETGKTSFYQELQNLYNAFESVGDSWTKNHKWISSSIVNDINRSTGNTTLEQQISQKVLAKLNDLIEIARKMYAMMEEQEKIHDGRIKGETIGDSLSESYSNKENTCSSPHNPTTFAPAASFSMELDEFANTTYASPFLLPLRLQTVEKLRPIELKYLPSNLLPEKPAKCDSAFKVIDQMTDETKIEMRNVSTRIENNRGPKDSKNEKAMSTSSVKPSKKTVQVSPVSMPAPKGAPPPPAPPQLGVGKALSAKKSTKLKRSSHMGNLYRRLRGKLEGRGSNGKPSKGKKQNVRGSAEGKHGMADALAEMTKRSAYFQKIEEDVRNHEKLILEIKAAINSFQSKNMADLIRFHKHVEQHLEKLTDETQVLAKFEGFPIKKLETLRTAAVQYVKLQEIASKLEKWQVTHPLGQQLDKVESYFNKIKGEIDSLERDKDEETKKFKSNNIDFDFNILVCIKELMVDVSSSCMELALEEWKAAKAAESTKSGQKTNSQVKRGAKTLWRAFQLAFQVYSFAGGQDDRADILTRKLAEEIENGPQPE